MAETVTDADVAQLRACTQTSIRRLDRVLARYFDGALAPVGLRITQLSLLGALANIGPVLVNTLAEHLTMNGSTVTRNVGLLIGRGLVTRKTGADRRQQILEIAPQAARGGAARFLTGESHREKSVLPCPRSVSTRQTSATASTLPSSACPDGARSDGCESAVRPSLSPVVQ